MPPKKKKAGKKASKTKEVGGTKEQEMKKLELENEMLKMEVARNISLARKAQDDQKQIAEKVQEDETKQATKQEYLTDVAESFQRSLKQESLKRVAEEGEYQSQINSLMRRIEHLEANLSESKATHEKVVDEKDAKIKKLQTQIESLEANYQSVLHNAFMDLSHKISGLKTEWEDDGLDYLKKYGSLLLDFGLSPAELRAQYSDLDEFRL